MGRAYFGNKRLRLDVMSTTFSHSYVKELGFAGSLIFWKYSPNPLKHKGSRLLRKLWRVWTTV